MMRTLVIDTATAACSVALLGLPGDPTPLVRVDQVGRGHAERLIPMIADLPNGGHADHILVDVGPGSFTGIRVGIAAARGLALGWGATVSGYSSLSLIAANAFLDLYHPDPFAVVIEGGHGEVFMQSFAEHPQLHPLNEMISVTPADAMTRLGDRVALGSGVWRLPNLPATQNGGDNWFPNPYAMMLMPGVLTQLPPKPLYGRAPDAKPAQR